MSLPMGRLSVPTVLYIFFKEKALFPENFEACIVWQNLPVDVAFSALLLLF